MLLPDVDLSSQHCILRARDVAHRVAADGPRLTRLRDRAAPAAVDNEAACYDGGHKEWRRSKKGALAIIWVRERVQHRPRACRLGVPAHTLVGYERWSGSVGRVRLPGGSGRIHDPCLPTGSHDRNHD